MNKVCITAFLLYTIINLTLAALFIALEFDMITVDQVMDFYQTYTLNDNLMGVFGFLLIYINFVLIRHLFLNAVITKDIIFKTDDGQITVSTTAIQDLVTRIKNELSGIKDMRSRVYSRKRGIMILIKANLYEGVSIPEITEKIQHYVKARLRETLGSRHDIDVKIQIGKIVQGVAPGGEGA